MAVYLADKDEEQSRYFVALSRRLAIVGNWARHWSRLDVLRAEDDVPKLDKLSKDGLTQALMIVDIRTKGGSD